MAGGANGITGVDGGRTGVSRNEENLRPNGLSRKRNSNLEYTERHADDLEVRARRYGIWDNSIQGIHAKIENRYPYELSRRPGAGRALATASSMVATGDRVGDGGRELALLGAWGPLLVWVRLALNLKGLSYEYVEVDLASKSDLLLAANPIHRKIPMLLHAGKPICESMLIVE
uniref:Glutathione S-transferase n=1 Tax=Oryza nivara TaxID=4536 RepID=A0A0E0J4G5_ORYNI